jgi:hypothetical protein
MLRLPEQADRRLQQLMDRNIEGLLAEPGTAASVYAGSTVPSLKQLA